MPEAFRVGFVGFVIALMSLLSTGVEGMPQKGGPGRTTSGPGFSAPAVEYLQVKQGFSVRAWLGSNGTIGQGAFSNFLPPDDIGFEYPVGSRIEHLYGAGIWIGAIVDTGSAAGPARVRSVTTAYNWGEFGIQHEMYGHLTPRDTFFRTGVGVDEGRGVRGYDDDGDGLIDEDELDGYDNDGDWIVETDDLGSDGLPDLLETGCRGGYDSLSNPDPAFDNFDPAGKDLCHPDGFGNYPRKNNRYRYTQNNGFPDSGEPGVDEDFGAVSENDISIAYQDIFTDPLVPGHLPLGVRVWQKSYAWQNQVTEPILPFEFNIVNIGSRTLDSVWIGFFVDPLIGHIDRSDITSQKYSAYIPDLRTGYAHNVYDRLSTPIGVTVLGTPRPLTELQYTFQWMRFEDNPGIDRDLYELMSGGGIKPDEPRTPGSDSQFLLAFGPFESVRPGDTLQIVVALISGDGIEIGPNSLMENARRAFALYSSGYRVPVVPPSPPLRVTWGDRRVGLDWSWRPGDRYGDPMETWDDSNAFLSSLADTHWRRAHPPDGHGSGGRVFEGFRLWRSESPEFDPASFSLIGQYDVADDLGFGFDTGLRYSHTDSNLQTGRKYWYAVTSFGIPGVTINTIPLPGPGGGVRIDTLLTPPFESDKGQNARLVQLPFSPTTGPGGVKVVPNPYRTDNNYTFEEGGWEGRGRDWNEWKRVIWFTHLPEKAVIRIFTLTGELVTTIQHDDALRGSPGYPAGQEEWDLLSASGRAIASGIYVFTVESTAGTQVGKFAVIR